MFSRDALLSFSATKKDALYELLNREDLDWRKLQRLTAKKVVNANGKNQLSAFVINDTVKTRRGKKMPGVANDEQFVPIDNELFISQTKQQAVEALMRITF